MNLAVNDATAFICFHIKNQLTRICSDNVKYPVAKEQENPAIMYRIVKKTVFCSGGILKSRYAFVSSKHSCGVTFFIFHLEIS